MIRRVPIRLATVLLKVHAVAYTFYQDIAGLAYCWDKPMEILQLSDCLYDDDERLQF